ncbi:MAG TPA: M20 family metallopeptidase [Clostridia bacterium]|nr:M20 family metallopeptidase [Clostridia bacterium]
MNQLLLEAQEMYPELVEWRRTLHQHPEIGLDLPVTVTFVTDKLREMGYDPKPCAGGVVALLEGASVGKTVLLRADMDALPMEEHSGLPFKSTISGVAHTCGHDIHTAMLLGAAKLLMHNRSRISGNVKLMFQPGEEGYNGALDMIKSGVLQWPEVDAALALHTLVGGNHKVGSMWCAPDGPAKASSDTFEITVFGKGAHGATPEKGVDVINALGHIHSALQTINSREIAAREQVVLTVGAISAGQKENILPESGWMRGTIRTYSQELRDYIKQRIEAVSSKVAEALGARAEVVFSGGLPPTINDCTVASEMFSYVKELIGEENTGIIEPITGADDFAEITSRVPGVYMDLCFNDYASCPYSFHSPYIVFREEIMPVGAAAYAYCAARWLAEHC